MGDHSDDTDAPIPERVTSFIERALSPQSLIMLVIAFLGGIGAAKGTVHDSWQWTCVHALHRCTPPPPHYAIYDYITTDPKKPPKVSQQTQDFAPLGLVDGTPVEDISAMLPPTSQGTHHTVQTGSTPGWHREAWTWKGITISIDVQDTSHATRNVAVRTQLGNYYVAVGQGILLGDSTLQDAIDLSANGATSVTVAVPTSQTYSLVAEVPAFAFKKHAYTVTTVSIYNPPTFALPQRLKRNDGRCLAPILSMYLHEADSPPAADKPIAHSCLPPPLVLYERDGKKLVRHDLWRSGRGETTFPDPLPSP